MHIAFVSKFFYCILRMNVCNCFKNKILLQSVGIIVFLVQHRLYMYIKIFVDAYVCIAYSNYRCMYFIKYLLKYIFQDKGKETKP